MQNRGFLAEADCIKALNMIDAVFHDVPEVRNSWANLYAALNDKRNFPETGPTPILDERKTALLVGMAKDLGLVSDFRPDDFARVYTPTAVVTEMQIRDMQRKLMHTALAEQMQSAQQPPGKSTVR